MKNLLQNHFYMGQRQGGGVLTQRYHFHPIFIRPHQNPPEPIGFVYSPLEISPIKAHWFCVLPPLKNHPSKPFVLCTWKILWKNHCKSLFLVGAYFGVTFISANTVYGYTHPCMHIYECSSPKSHRTPRDNAVPVNGSPETQTLPLQVKFKNTKQKCPFLCLSVAFNAKL